MPIGENFWNPYRWVTLSNRPSTHDTPHYHHTFSALSGQLWCELEALTPLLIGDRRVPIQFVRHAHNGQPYIPGTSLKGAIRSLVEVLGNGTTPPANHQPGATNRQLDTASRTFGYSDRSDIFTGLIRFSDAEISEPITPMDMRQWQEWTVVVGAPKRTHTAFYPQGRKHKFYHHHPGAIQLVPPHPGVTQTTIVRPAPPRTSFHFTVDFTNLREEELNVLLYSLALEEQVTVRLSPEALGRKEDNEGEEFCGPLRHKIGGAKPHGAGSVHIRITKMQLCRDAAARYRGNTATDILEKTSLTNEIYERTASFQNRTDTTMRELRAMLIYSTDDPRTPIHYPTYRWFNTQQGAQTQLKPTL